MSGPAPSAHRSPGRTRSRAGILALFVVVSGLLGLLSAACQDASAPLGLDERSTPTLQVQGDLGFSPEGVLTFLQTPDLSLSRHAGKLIKAAEGGSVDLAGFRVDIPAGALDRDTFITIDLPLALPAASYVVADFGPSGTRFSKPVTITLPLSGASLGGVDLSQVKVSYWNGVGWENYGGQATSTSVTSGTTHFSTYGARTQRGGIDTTSGG